MGDVGNEDMQDLLVVALSAPSGYSQVQVGQMMFCGLSKFTAALALMIIPLQNYLDFQPI